MRKKCDLINIYIAPLSMEGEKLWIELNGAEC